MRAWVRFVCQCVCVCMLTYMNGIVVVPGVPKKSIEGVLDDDRASADDMMSPSEPIEPSSLASKQWTPGPRILGPRVGLRGAAAGNKTEASSSILMVTSPPRPLTSFEPTRERRGSSASSSHDVPDLHVGVCACAYVCVSGCVFVWGGKGGEGEGYVCAHARACVCMGVFHVWGRQEVGSNPKMAAAVASMKRWRW